MRRILLATGVSLMALALAGCRDEVSPAPSPARVPGPDERRISTDQPQKPLPENGRGELPEPPFNDVPLVSQEAPETPRFIEAYNKVGRPRILVWVSHEFAGRHELASGIDYAAMENILTDWLSAGWKVAVIAPEAARQMISPRQALALDRGQAVAATQEIADRIRADVLVLVRAEPTQQTAQGPAIRLVADAANIKGAESIGRAVVDVPGPLDKPQINTYTRFVARKLMADMTNSWTSFGGAEPVENPRAGQPLPPATQPSGGGAGPDLSR